MKPKRKRRVSPATLARLKAMRKKYGLGEFRKRKRRTPKPAQITPRAAQPEPDVFEEAEFLTLE